MPENTFLLVFFTWKQNTASVQNQIVQLSVNILSVNEEKHSVGAAEFKTILPVEGLRSFIVRTYGKENLPAENHPEAVEFLMKDLSSSMLIASASFSEHARLSLSPATDLKKSR